MTSKVNHRTVRVIIFLMPVDHNKGIEMKQKELSKTFMMLSNYVEVF